MNDDNNRIALFSFSVGHAIFFVSAFGLTSSFITYLLTYLLTWNTDVGDNDTATMLIIATFLCIFKQQIIILICRLVDVFIYTAFTTCIYCAIVK